MNEKRIEQVMAIERQAQELIAEAAREAERLPRDADNEARETKEKAREAAREEARLLLQSASSDADTAAVASKSAERIEEMERLATQNMDRAVAHLLDQVLGKD